MSASDVHGAIETIWRLESAKLIASLTRVVRDIDTAEDLAQEALVAALKQWPNEGIPQNPGAWLMTAARRRGIDHLRRRQMLVRKHGELAYELHDASRLTRDLDADLDDDVGDDLLRLIFTACHPVLSRDARLALTLRLLGGLSTEEIARAFLSPEPTIAQRIVRAKKTIAAKQLPFDVPRGDELAERLASVLEVIYLIFNAGYTATSGDDWIRASLCEEALRLARVLAALSPAEPEVHGLVALLEIQASRLRARIGPGGEPILLDDQDRSKWDRLLINRGLEALATAERLGGARGPYALQAAIAACHARAVTPNSTDWPRIVALYDVLLDVLPSPIVGLNRAVAVGRASGPAAGLEALAPMLSDGALEGYHLLRAVEGDLLDRLGRKDEAGAAFEAAAAMTSNARERDVLQARAAACRTASE